jgi:Tol biopolymer transport system component
MDFDLWLQPLRDGVPTGDPRLLTDQPGTEAHPVFSPDDKWVAYYRVVGTTRNIWIIPTAGGEPVQITDSPAQDIQPAWSSDGSLLAFVSYRDQNPPYSYVEDTGQLWLVPMADGRRTGPPEQLTQGEMTALAPSFSPDGTQIAFVGYRQSTGEAWTVSVDGQKPPRRVSEGAEAGHVRWDPTSNALLVSGTWNSNYIKLKRVSLENGEVMDFNPEIIFGDSSFYYSFDISDDGRLLTFMRRNRSGNIWVLEGKPNSF